MTDITLPAPTTLAHPSRLLRTALTIDAVLSGLSGLLMVVDAAPLSGTLGLPTELLRTAGFVLLPWAAAVGWLARRPTVSRRSVWTVIALNVLWALDCIALLFSGWVTPTGLGTAFVIVQTVAVVGLAELQWFGLRRSVA